MTGTLSAGSYVNLHFLFESEYTGTLSSPNDDLNVSALDGQVVDVEGWFVNNGSKNNNGTYFTVVARSVTANETVASGSFTTTPTTFAATDPQPQTLNYTANEAAGTVTFEITGTNVDKFSYSDNTGSSVTVSATGANDSDAAYTATLTMKAADGTVLASVDLRQSAPATGDEGPAYLWTLASGDMKAAGGETPAVGEPTAMVWSYSSAGYLQMASNSSAMQIGSSKKPATDWSVWTEEYSGTISKIVVTVNTGGSATMIVKIGDTQIGEEVALESSPKAFTFEPTSPMSGKITINLKAASKAMYLKSIAINPAE